MMSLYAPSTNGQMSEDEREEESEQDDALNLVVTPKKKRHKVTDTRITPRTVSRLLGDQPSMAELQKHFGPSSPFMPPGFPMPKLLGDLPRPPFHHLPFPTIPRPPQPAATVSLQSLWLSRASWTSSRLLTSRGAETPISLSTSRPSSTSTSPPPGHPGRTVPGLCPHEARAGQGERQTRERNQLR